MSYDYEPQEGLDYLTDLYEVVGVPRDAQDEVLKDALRTKTREYHPDRLEGLAPEFRARGEQMVRLLNRARGILLDADKRAQYDEILGVWEGPISDDGTPIITMDSHMKSLPAEELEAGFQAQRQQIESMTGYKPGAVELFERMIEAVDGDVDPALREAYENALLDADSVFAVEEGERSRLLGINLEERRYEAATDYTALVEGEIEEARASEQKRLHMIMLGNVPTRLALLSGDHSTPPLEDVHLPARPEDVQLPSYFEAQAEKVKELASQREVLLEKRLANFQPTYVLSELQVQKFETVAVGIEMNGRVNWFCAQYNPETEEVGTTLFDEGVQDALEAGQFAEVIEAGISVMTFEPLEQIELVTQLNEALTKHIEYFLASWANQK